MDTSNHPLYIHCNQGKHRTGCVVACLRKVQGVPVEEVIQEYVAYSYPKHRPGDIALIEAFDPECVFEYAKNNGYFTGGLSKFSYNDSTICNIAALAAAMALGATSTEDSDETMSISSGMTDLSLETNQGLEMSLLASPVVPAPKSNGLTTNGGQAQIDMNEIKMTDRIDSSLISKSQDRDGDVAMAQVPALDRPTIDPAIMSSFEEFITVPLDDDSEMLA